MLSRRLDELLAQTDPFDLAQAVERHVRTLSAAQIHGLIHDALPRMSDYYAQEFSRIHALTDQPLLRSAFAQSLKSNLRAIPLFGGSFGDALLALAPAPGPVGFGEEPAQKKTRWLAGGVVAAALALAAAGGIHYVRSERAQAASASAEPFAVAPAPGTSAPRFAVRRAAPANAQRRQHPARARVAAAPVFAAPAVAAPYVPPVTHPVKPAPRRSQPPVARGQAVVVVPVRRVKSNETVQSNGIDLSDMPQPYTDASPIPNESPAALTAPRGVRVDTPAPAPKRHGWLHRAIMHLDPFKPKPQETP